MLSLRKLIWCCLFPGKGAPFSWVRWQREQSGNAGSERFACELLVSVLYSFVINDVPVNFRTSLMFPVNCFYVNPWSLPFVQVSAPSTRGMGVGKGGSEQVTHGFEGITASTKLGSTIPKAQHKGKQSSGRLIGYIICDKFSYFQLSKCFWKEEKEKKAADILLDCSIYGNTCWCSKSTERGLEPLFIISAI